MKVLLYLFWAAEKRWSLFHESVESSGINSWTLFFLWNWHNSEVSLWLSPTWPYSMFDSYIGYHSKLIASFNETDDIYQLAEKIQIVTRLDEKTSLETGLCFSNSLLSHVLLDPVWANEIIISKHHVFQSSYYLFIYFKEQDPFITVWWPP